MKQNARSPSIEQINEELNDNLSEEEQRESNSTCAYVSRSGTRIDALYISPISNASTTTSLPSKIFRNFISTLRQTCNLGFLAPNE
ncbi:hypothetical protein NPIL_641511 [Nephila pilipes]|uniref:Uncharacterized protein n=1 Tax=Nephila pilipes TaxID=299642 RepID=A0A8X6MS95_NEPPI|nr:hypothetical protein NPIL_641511 [Nephila pilipes]